MAVRLVQLLCERRHTILAVAYEPGKESTEAVIEMFKATVERLLREKTILPTCALCASTSWKYEDAPTVYATLAEAMPPLLSMQAAMFRARAAIYAGRN